MGLLDSLFAPFLGILTGGLSAVDAEAKWLMRVFIGIEIVTAASVWWTAQEQVILLFANKIVRIGLFGLFVVQWPIITTMFLDTMVWTGAQTSHGELTIDEFKSPSTLFGTAFKVTKPLFDWMNKVNASGWRATMANLGTIMLYAFTALLVWLSFLLMALHVMIAQVMFYLSTAFLLIFVPFGVYTGTAFLAERAIGAVISSAVRVGMMAAVVGIVFPIMKAWALPDPALGVDPTTRQAFIIAGAAVGAFALTWVVPSWSASLFEGGAVLTGQNLVMGVTRPAMNLITGSADLVGQATSSLLKRAA